jgi:mRNA-degrading endonuclease RelE of RelBE toxin-antitoxin system
MGRYKVTLSKSAAKELSKLFPPVTNKIIRVISDLTDNPRPAGSKKLKGGFNGASVQGTTECYIRLMTKY